MTSREYNQLTFNESLEFSFKDAERRVGVKVNFIDQSNWHPDVAIVVALREDFDKIDHVAPPSRTAQQIQNLTVRPFNYGTLNLKFNPAQWGYYLIDIKFLKTNNTFTLEQLLKQLEDDTRRN